MNRDCELNLHNLNSKLALVKCELCKTLLFNIVIFIFCQTILSVEWTVDSVLYFSVDTMLCLCSG